MSTATQSVKSESSSGAFSSHHRSMLKISFVQHCSPNLFCHLSRSKGVVLISMLNFMMVSGLLADYIGYLDARSAITFLWTSHTWASWTHPVSPRQVARMIREYYRRIVCSVNKIARASFHFPFMNDVYVVSVFIDEGQGLPPEQWSDRAQNRELFNEDKTVAYVLAFVEINTKEGRIPWRTAKRSKSFWREYGCLFDFLTGCVSPHQPFSVRISSFKFERFETDGSLETALVIEIAGPFFRARIEVDSYFYHGFRRWKTSQPPESISDEYFTLMLRCC